MSKKSSGRWDEATLIKKGYSQNPDGSWANPPIKSAFIKSLSEKVIVKEIVNENSDFVIASKYPITINVTPIGKPRMTQRDKWLKPSRKPVKHYWEYKEALVRESRLKGFEMLSAGLHLTFVIPMPNSWSEKKRNQMNNTPHQQRSDCDNILKGFQDCLCSEDSHIWDVRITKIWGVSGKIIINQI